MISRNLNAAIETTGRADAFRRASVIDIVFVTYWRQFIDWNKVGEEGMRHFQSLVQIDSTGAPGTETKARRSVQRQAARSPEPGQSCIAWRKFIAVIGILTTWSM
jgi:hypothetical protein